MDRTRQHPKPPSHNKLNRWDVPVKLPMGGVTKIALAK